MKRNIINLRFNDDGGRVVTFYGRKQKTRRYIPTLASLNRLCNTLDQRRYSRHSFILPWPDGWTWHLEDA